jgi:hypothetical protein
MNRYEQGKIEGIAICLTSCVGILDNNGGLAVVKEIIPNLITIHELKKYVPLDYEILSDYERIKNYFNELEEANG